MFRKGQQYYRYHRWGGKAGKTVCLRADMDALPVTEATGLPFSSRHEGCMHACGHDTHTAMLLATGKVLWAHRQEIAGTVRLLFQTSESSPAVQKS